MTLINEYYLKKINKYKIHIKIIINPFRKTNKKKLIDSSKLILSKYFSKNH